MPIRPENRDRYPADWPEISRSIRFDRAGGRCECVGQCGYDHGGRCTARNGDATKSGALVVLTVAHLDHTPEHNAPENLLAACQACHLRYDAEHHRQTAAATRRAAIEAAGQLTLLHPLWEAEPMTEPLHAASLDTLRFATSVEEYLTYARVQGVSREVAQEILQPLLTAGRADAFRLARAEVIERAYPPATSGS